MPELPEVEQVVRSLARARIDAPVVALWRSPKDLRTGEAWRRELEGLEGLLQARPRTPTRRAKFVLWPFDAPVGPRRLLLHLGMSGRCEISPRDAPLADHTHLRLSFDDGRELRFVDPRRFGGLNVGEPAIQDTRAPLRDLGPEPLGADFDGAHLARTLGRSARSVRDGLLDQGVVAGLGNIYVAEALFEARIHPLCRARRLRPCAWDRVAAAVVSVLRRGIANGGTTLRDYRDASGRAGRNQHALFVYGRAQAPCRSCATPLEQLRLGGRAAVFCPRCQPNPRTRWVS